MRNLNERSPATAPVMHKLSEYFPKKRKMQPLTDLISVEIKAQKLPKTICKS